MNCLLFAKIDQIFSLKNKTLKNTEKMEKDTVKVREKSGNFVGQEKWEPCPGGVPDPGGCTWTRGGTCPGTPPPVNRMTDRCKNITLPQTSFADGNNGFYCTKWVHLHLLFGQHLNGLKSSIMSCAPIFCNCLD